MWRVIRENGTVSLAFSLFCKEFEIEIQILLCSWSLLFYNDCV